ncbi:DUF802 domain-containing protein [Lysobacter sp. N42]|uniref:DUF802 domain-containing protein n=1 Tax=Lysobacter sp. N42 TaxID=2545719 RepID=UPI00104FF06D|nr:DUF802 domain-containing protein [Lysobacter sp. N42]TCZ83080.1 DUF802 domain-containing protein [Lysobacter sp. N42]
MPRNLLKPVIFLAGLAALGWIAAGYAGTSLPALSVVLLIAGCYVAGGVELQRYGRATSSLARTVEATTEPVARLADWLAPLPASLRQVVRQRVEGERVPLPAPALTPYLVGLLVLLGMLGTLLGMMATLQGTGAALASASDLDAIRSALAAPVQGLAFAFGTSIAGVAASAMLGLLSALCRRERAAAVLKLDEAIATRLRGHSRSHQRDEALRLLQRQADVMPALVDRLTEAMAAITQQGAAAHERQLADQAAFHARIEAGQAQLAASLERMLQAGVAESARAAGAALQPVAETTLAALVEHAAALRDDVDRATRHQLDALARTLEAGTTTVAGLWTSAAAEQRGANERLAERLGDALARFDAAFEHRAGALADRIADRFDAATDAAAQAWRDALARQDAQAQALAAGQAQALDLAATRLEATGERTSAAWAAMLAQQAEQGRALAEDNGRALAAAAATFEAHAASLVASVGDSHAQLQARLEAQMQAQARGTLDEIARLVDEAAQAPRAAAAVIAELRQTLTDTLRCDNAMLEERGRLLATVDTLLAAVNHASAEQRSAIDALITASADALDRVTARFGVQVDAQAGRLDAAADRLAAGAIEVASLGDAFGAAVERFGEANTQLVERLQAIEGALQQSLARSDDQLAYYVAQAREVVDLSVLTQRQIIGELQKLAPHADRAAHA